MSEPSVATRLRELRTRAKISMATLANALKFRGTSGYQRYEDPALYKKEFLPLEFIPTLLTLFVGRGEPPITESEVRDLGGGRDLLRAIEKPRPHTLRPPSPDDLEARFSAKGLSFVFSIESDTPVNRRLLMMMAHIISTIQEEENWQLGAEDFQAVALMLHDMILLEEDELLKVPLGALDKEAAFQIWLTAKILGRLLARKLKSINVDE